MIWKSESMIILFSLWFIIGLCLIGKVSSVHNNVSAPYTSSEHKIDDKLKSKRIEWSLYANLSYRQRATEMKEILTKFSGVYINQTANGMSLAQSKRLHRTVLINVIELGDNGDESRYQHFLRNELCYYKYYGFKSLLYIISNDTKLISREREELKLIHPNLEVVTYPDYLFWQLVSQKTNNLQKGFGKGDYEGNRPSFSRFGSLVMLIPMLEALELGHHVIYFDVDVALIQDPIPYLLHGDADVIVSTELRTCSFPSVTAETNWDSVEPNTGVMHIRSTQPVIKWYRLWLGRIIKDNSMNDQRLVDFNQFPNSIRTDNCKSSLWQSSVRPDIFYYLHSKSASVTSHHETNLEAVTTTSKQKLSYCFLNEFEFQNGMMEFFCSMGKKGGLDIQHLYYLSMANKTYPLSAPRPTSTRSRQLSKWVDLSNTLLDAPKASSSTSKDIFYAPVTLHVNFCISKQNSLEERGLWLYNQSQMNPLSPKYGTCQPYQIQRTSYYLRNWQEKIHHAQEQVKDLLSQAPLQDTDPVKFTARGAIYCYMKGEFRMIPNRETFVAMGYDFNQVQVLSSPLYRMIPIGAWLPDLSSSHTSTSMGKGPHSGKRFKNNATSVGGNRHPNHRTTAPSSTSTSTSTQATISIQDVETAYNRTLYTTEHMPKYEFKPKDPIGIDQLIPMAKKLSEFYHDPLRNITLQAIFELGQGIYTHKPYATQSRANHTVLINVIESGNDNYYHKYKPLIKNFLCFSKHFHLQNIIYIIDSNATRFKLEAQELKKIDKNVLIMEYPYELFWKLIMTKKNEISFKNENVFYQNNYPTFKDFGFLVMLIPILEALQWGYHVMYFDIDIAFVRDPIPYITLGQSDYQLSPEMRTCSSQSIKENAKHINWDSIEPNSGIMFIRSNPKSIIFFMNWIDVIIQENTNNDQKKLKFQEFDGYQTFDCNPFSMDFYPNILPPNNSASKLSFCFLNEFLFQNGKLAFGCGFSKGGMRTEYMLALASMRYDGASEIPYPRKYPYIGNLDEFKGIFEDIEMASKAKDPTPFIIAPRTVHANYCDHKERELRNLGLWLVSEKDDWATCQNYNISETYYSRLNWTSEMFYAENDFLSIKLIPNNTVFKIRRRSTVFVKINNEARGFTTGETFTKMGYDWNNIRTLEPYSYFLNFTFMNPFYYP